MSQAPRSDVDARRPAPGTSVTYTIKVLDSVATEGGQAVQRVLFSRVAGGEVIEIRAETDGGNLLAKLPELLDAALEIQRSVWVAQRTVARLPAGCLPRLVEESRLLRWLTLGPLDAEDRELERVLREARLLRDVAWEAIRAVLPQERHREVDALAGLEEQPAELAAGLDGIATLIEGMLGDPEDSALMAACDIDGGYAASLRRQAAALRRRRIPGEAPSE